MMRRSLLLAAALLAGCAQVSERVVLLPDSDGRPGALVVKSAAGETELAKPYAAVELRGERLEAKQLDADEVRRRYAAVLAAQPPQPRSHLLYFDPRGCGLTRESQEQLRKIKAELLASAAGEIVIIGHTDRVGTEDFNDKLSLNRAEKVRDMLKDMGVRAGAMTLVGRGEREPAVPTDDEVAEPRNRRVEIKLR
jgi:outer membrane protein OmpA-like peptidoglycan-associated protein